MKIKVNNKVMSMLIAGGIVVGSIPFNVFADSVSVVTIGESLSAEQRETVFNYFGTSEDSVDVIEVTNLDERKYLEGVASEEQIGNKTFSCAYVEPTNEGGIQVKTANLTYVTSSMIASTLMTSGVQNANVIAMTPLNGGVSGTGALTGLMMAYEKSSGESLDEEKKEIANEELIATGDLSEEVGKDKATGIINDIKTEIIKNGTKDTTQIAETINNVTNNYNIVLGDSAIAQLTSLMEKIAAQDYKYEDVKATLDTVTQNVDKNLEAIGEEVKRGNFFENMFSGIGDFFSGIFGGGEKETNKNLGILENTNDDVLGENAQIDATDDKVVNVDTEAIKEEAKNIFQKIGDWFSNLFESILGGKEEPVKVEEIAPETTEPGVEGEEGLDNGKEGIAPDVEGNEDTTDEVVNDSNDTAEPNGDESTANEGVGTNEESSEGSEGDLNEPVSEVIE